MKKSVRKFFGKLFYENGDPKLGGFVFLVTVSIISALVIEELAGLLSAHG